MLSKINLLKLIDPISICFPKTFRKLVSTKTQLSDQGCIIRPGGLGDLVILTLAALNLNIDIWKIIWIVERRNKIWCDYLKLPYQCYDQFELPKRGFNWVIDTEQTFGLSGVYATLLVNANGLLGGFATTRSSKMYDFSVNHPLAKQHEIQTFASLLTLADKKINFVKLSKEVKFESKERKPYVLIAIGGRQSKERMISIENWVKIAKIATKYSNEIYLIGAKVDREFSEALESKFPYIKENYVGLLSFEQSVDLIKDSSRLVSIDSGLVHVSSFFNVPATAIFVDQAKKERWSALSSGSENIMLGELVND